MLDFQKWLEENWGDEDEMLPPGMTPEQALEFLKDYFLGDSWYVNYPAGPGQICTEIVAAILERHSKRYQEELKRARRQKDIDAILARLEKAQRARFDRYRRTK